MITVANIGRVFDFAWCAILAAFGYPHESAYQSQRRFFGFDPRHGSGILARRILFFQRTLRGSFYLFRRWVQKRNVKRAGQTTRVGPH